MGGEGGGLRGWPCDAARGRRGCAVAGRHRIRSASPIAMSALSARTVPGRAAILRRSGEVCCCRVDMICSLWPAGCGPPGWIGVRARCVGTVNPAGLTSPVSR